jgi:hypothetical protein
MRVGLALAEVSQLVSELQGGADPKATVRSMVFALGRVSPALEDLDAILSDARRTPEGLPSALGHERPI